MKKTILFVIAAIMVFCLVVGFAARTTSTSHTTASKATVKAPASGKGSISKETGRVKDHYTKGYTKKNGTVVKGYWHS